MKTLEELQALMPGVEFVGMHIDPRVNHGAPTPIFTSKPPADGHPSINTVEGWNAAADRINRRSFVFAFGREPKNDAEVDAWVMSLTTR